MNQKPRLFNLPNLITAGNLICGSLAIILAFSGHLEMSPFFILGAAFLDFFDGLAARLLKVQSEMGKQLDSLADMVSFGLAPGIIMMAYLINLNFEPFIHGEMSGFLSWIQFFSIPLQDSSLAFWIPLSGLLLPFFTLFRLAKFNIDERQTVGFIGLPSPASALFFMTFPLLLAFGYFGDNGNVFQNLALNSNVIMILLLAFGLLMVSELPLFSLKLKHLKWKENEVRIVFILFVVILIPLFKVWSIAIIVFLYLILSLLSERIDKKEKEIRMKFKAEIDVMPLEALLDPQGKAVTNSMANIGLAGVSNVRIGRHVRMELDAKDEAEANSKVETACKKLLSNAIMESYTFHIEAIG